MALSRLLALALIISLIPSIAFTQAQPTTRDRPFLGVFTEPIKADDPKSGLKVTFLFLVGLL